MKLCRTCKVAKGPEDFHADWRLKTGYKTNCKACVSQDHKEYYKKPGVREKQLKRAKDRRAEYMLENPQLVWAREALKKARERARERDLPFELTLEWLMENMPARCPCLGIEFEYGKGMIVSGTPTVDKIDPSKGYTKENSWIISAKANTVKSNATVDEIRAVAQGLENRIKTGPTPWI